MDVVKIYSLLFWTFTGSRWLSYLAILRLSYTSLDIVQEWIGFNSYNYTGLLTWFSLGSTQLPWELRGELARCFLSHCSPPQPTQIHWLCYAAFLLISSFFLKYFLSECLLYIVTLLKFFFYLHCLVYINLFLKPELLLFSRTKILKKQILSSKLTLGH